MILSVQRGEVRELLAYCDQSLSREDAKRRRDFLVLRLIGGVYRILREREVAVTLEVFYLKA